MTTTAKIYNHLEVSIGGEIKEIGSRIVPAEVEVDGEAFEVRTVITNTALDNFNRQVLWQHGDGGIDDFDILVVESDADVLLELTIDRAVTPEYFLHKVTAGVPLILTSDDMLAAIATDGTVETMDQIDQVAVKLDADGTDADETATVRLLLLT